MSGLHFSNPHHRQALNATSRKMKRADLTGLSAFETVVDFNIDGENIDLHNDYSCTEIETNPYEKLILFHFESEIRYFRLVFSQATVLHFQLLPLALTPNRGLTFDWLSRTTAIVNDEGNHLELPDTAGFYIVEFHEDLSMVIKAQQVMLLESSKTDLELRRSLKNELTSVKQQLTTLQRELADLQNHGEQDTKTFLNQRKYSREELVHLEKEFVQKQEQLSMLEEQDRLLLTQAFSNSG